MTELLYQTDSYLKEFSAVVTLVDAQTRAVILDRLDYSLPHILHDIVHDETPLIA